MRIETVNKKQLNTENGQTLNEYKLIYKGSSELIQI